MVMFMCVGPLLRLCGGWQGGGSPLRALSEVTKHRSIEPGKFYFGEVKLYENPLTDSPD